MKFLLLFFIFLSTNPLFSQIYNFCSVHYTDTLQQGADSVWVGHFYKTIEEDQRKTTGNYIYQVELIYKNQIILDYNLGESPIKSELLTDSILHSVKKNWSSYIEYTYYPSGQLKTKYSYSDWWIDMYYFYYKKSKESCHIKKVVCDNLWGIGHNNLFIIKMNYKHYPYFILGKGHYKGHPFHVTKLYFKEAKLGLEKIREK